MDTKTVTRTPIWHKIGDWVVERMEQRKPVRISKKKYCLSALFFGWMGVHQFLLGKKYTGAFYLLTCVTGLSVILTAMDLFHAVFLVADEDGMICLK